MIENLLIARGTRAGMTAGVAMLAILAATVGCASKKEPVVKGIDSTVVGTAPPAAQKLFALKAPEVHALMTPSSSPMIAARVTLSKSALFNRSFLYGADLQYSTVGDAKLSLVLQSIAIGHIPVKFRLVDDRLQMVADQSTKFESNINRPERLVHEFRVVSESLNSLTVELRNASPILPPMFAEANGAKPGKELPAPRSTWVRSAQFAPEGEYLMFETSVKMPDGSIGEFMESVFPRETLVPADAKPIFNDKNLEPNAARYRFIDTGDLWIDVEGKGRKRTKVATRFNVKGGDAAVVWYVTPNMPSEFMPEIRTGIEAWNRYSQAMWNKDIVRFGGVLPDGIKIGDPRYNVINWDSVEKAGAAYESQAADPLTGIQSHSLIYLPKAWVNIGREYWEAGKASDKEQKKIEKIRKVLDRASVLGQKLPVSCLNDVSAKLTLASRTSPEDFAKELLKAVLFHEVGHALGLAHNFKASLVMDLKDPKSQFTASIMDYNQFHLERDAFESVSSAHGPLLEYDRQIMSVLYNDGKDVKANDPVIPACEDTESDDEEDGMDPLCLRYDASSDPTEFLVRTVNLVKTEDAEFAMMKSLPSAIRTLKDELPDPASVQTKEQAEAALAKQAKTISGLTAFYYASGAQSIARAVRANIRSLRAFKDEILPTTFSEPALRARAVSGLRYALGAESFEKPTQAAIETHLALVSQWLSTTAYAATLGDDRSSQISTLMKGLREVPAALEKNVLTAMRAQILAELRASEGSPFYVIDDGSHLMDFEREAAQLLARAVTQKLFDGSDRALPERMAAAKALKTFENSAMGESIYTSARQVVLTEARTARSTAARKDAMTVYMELQKKSQNDEEE